MKIGKILTFLVLAVLLFSGCKTIDNKQVNKNYWIRGSAEVKSGSVGLKPDDYTIRLEPNETKTEVLMFNANPESKGEFEFIFQSRQLDCSNGKMIAFSVYPC